MPAQAAEAPLNVKSLSSRPTASLKWLLTDSSSCNFESSSLGSEAEIRRGSAPSSRGLGCQGRVCVRSSMYVCLYVCMYACMHVRRAYVYTDIHAHIHEYLCLYAGQTKHMCNNNMTYMHMLICVHIYANTFAHIHMHACMYVRVFACTSVCMYVCFYLCACICICMLCMYVEVYMYV